MDAIGTDSLSASSTGAAVVTYEDVPVVITISNSVLSTSLSVGSDSLWAFAGAEVDASAEADTTMVHGLTTLCMVWLEPVPTMNRCMPMHGAIRATITLLLFLWMQALM